MILGFTGTRAGLTAPQRAALIDAMEYFRPTEQHTLLHGGAVGADTSAHGIARMLGWRTEVYPAAGVLHHAGSAEIFHTATVCHAPMPPLPRNHIIVNRCGRLWACPAGVEVLRSGTWATIRYARKLHRQVIIIWPNGSVGDA